MKRTTKQYNIECKRCRGVGRLAMEIEDSWVVCKVCDGEGRISVKETIEESDDMKSLSASDKTWTEMKDFIEKKLGWVLMEPVKMIPWQKITFK